MSNIALPTDLQQVMSDKIKEIIFGLLPDSAIEAKVREELDAFFESPSVPFTVHPRSSSYGSTGPLNMEVSPLHLVSPISQVVETRACLLPPTIGASNDQSRRTFPVV